MAKPRKVEESAGTYFVSRKRKAESSPPAKTPAQPAVRYLDDASAQAIADKIFSERKKLLRKLAQ